MVNSDNRARNTCWSLCVQCSALRSFSFNILFARQERIVRQETGIAQRGKKRRRGLRRRIRWPCLRALHLCRHPQLIWRSFSKSRFTEGQDGKNRNVDLALFFRDKLNFRRVRTQLPRSELVTSTASEGLLPRSQVMQQQSTYVVDVHPPTYSHLFCDRIPLELIIPHLARSEKHVSFAFPSIRKGDGAFSCFGPYSVEEIICWSNSRALHIRSRE